MNFLIKFLLSVVVIGCVDQLFGYAPSQVKAFKNAIKNSTKVVNCAKCDFRGVQELAGVDAHGLYAPGVSFQPCVSHSGNINAFMVCMPNQVANLKGINLSKGNYFASCFDQAILDNADLSGADFTNSSVVYASLNNAKVGGIITTNATFCNSIMPDGATCTDTWTGQGVTIKCLCTGKESGVTATTDSTASTVAPAA